MINNILFEFNLIQIRHISTEPLDYYCGALGLLGTQSENSYCAQLFLLHGI